MIAINLNFAIATVLIHDNHIYIADYACNIYVYDSSAQLIFNFSLQVNQFFQTILLITSVLLFHFTNTTGCYGC
jgi:hypothetical protein